MAELLLYWREHPPVHINLQALVNGFTGPADGATARKRPGAQSTDITPIDGLSQMLGPPSQKLRPPCRMLPTTAVQSSAQPIPE